MLMKTYIITKYEMNLKEDKFSIVWYQLSLLKKFTPWIFTFGSPSLFINLPEALDPKPLFSVFFWLIFFLNPLAMVVCHLCTILVITIYKDKILFLWILSIETRGFWFRIKLNLSSKFYQHERFSNKRRYWVTSKFFL